MVRIKAMPARFGAAPPIIAPLLGSGAERDRNREARVEWRAWYRSPEWRRLRADVLLDAGYTCVICRQAHADQRKLVCDHKVPHRGDRDLFFLRSNLQCLCKTCHDGAKQRAERSWRG